VRGTNQCCFKKPFSLRHVSNSRRSTVIGGVQFRCKSRLRNPPFGAFDDAITECVIRASLQPGGVPKTGSFYDTGTKAAAFHPFAGPLSRSKVSQVALRESR
jgi:hypothetical protein